LNIAFDGEHLIRIVIILCLTKHWILCNYCINYNRIMLVSRKHHIWIFLRMCKNAAGLNVLRV